MKDIFNRYKTNPGAILLGLLIAAALIIMATSTKAKADKTALACTFGGYGSYVAGLAIPDGSPFGYGSNGQNAGGSLGCDTTFDKFVLGGEVSYGWMFGNLNDLGIDNDLTVMARAGYVLPAGVMPYGHLDWARLTGAGSHIDGYKFGLGVEWPLGGSLFADARYSHGIWDVPGASGVDVTSDEFRIGLKVKLGPMPAMQSMADAPAEPAKKPKKIAP